METLVHGKPRRRKTFAEHCSKGYVLGTSFEYYRAWIMWMKETKATRISGTVFQKHKYITNPDMKPEDRVISAMDNLSQELREMPPEHLSKTTLGQLTTLVNIIKQNIEGKDKQYKIAQQKQDAHQQLQQLALEDKFGCGLTLPIILPNPKLF